MDTYKLQGLLKRDEDAKLDFKLMIDLKSEGGKKEISKDIIAMANTSGGRGYIIVGIEDKTKKVIGVEEDTFSEERIQQIVSNRADPPINLRVETIDYETKKILVITIFRSLKRPHQMRQTGAFYVRRGSTTDFARRNEIASMLQNEGMIYNELIPVYNADLKALDDKKVDDFIEKSNMFSGDRLKLMANLGIIHYDKFEAEYFPTIGGLLLFGNNPQIYLPHTSIEIINNLNNYREDYKVTGSLIDLIDKATEIVGLLLKYTKYPIDVIEEAIANAVVHRDYYDKSRQIVVYISKHKIEISNPGSSFGREVLNNTIKDSNPSRRNIWLYSKLLTLDEKSRFKEYGLGLEKMKKKIKSNGRVKFINHKKINLFRVILPGPERNK